VKESFVADICLPVRISKYYIKKTSLVNNNFVVKITLFLQSFSNVRELNLCEVALVPSRLFHDFILLVADSKSMIKNFTKEFDFINTNFKLIICPATGMCKY